MKTDNVKQSVKNVFLAGLGAMSVAQKEAGKTFDKFIKEGKKFEKESKKSINKLTDTAESKFDKFKNMGKKQFNKVENIFEKKVESALGKLDIPTTNDIGELNKRLETLIKEVKKLEKKAA